MKDEQAVRFYEDNIIEKAQRHEAQISQLQKLSARLGAPPTGELNDVQVGDGAGSWITKTLAQFQVILGFRERLTADRTLYVRTVPVPISFTIASPCVVTWTAHGLAADAPVVFRAPPNRATITVTIASPGVVTWTNHGLVANDPVAFFTTGALPTGMVAGTTYYVVSAGLTASTFRFSATPGGAAINTSGAQSGIHNGNEASLFPTGLSSGVIVYVVGASITTDTFQVSVTPGGAAINTSGSQYGKFRGSTGSDSYDGLSADADHAFLTIQHAVSVMRASIDLGSYNVYIQLADGAYLEAVSLYHSPTGAGRVYIQGNSTFPSNVIISATGADAIQVYEAGLLYVKDLELQTITSGTCLVSYQNSLVLFSNIVFRSATSHIVASDNGIVLADGNYSIFGNVVSAHMQAVMGGIIRIQGRTITLINNPTFSNFAAFVRMSKMFVNGNTYTGGGTGTRYSGVSNSLADTVGGGASYFPGTVGGAVDASSIYL